MTESPKGQRDHLTEQRQALLDTLTSEQHYHETPTLVYGRHNPLEVAVASCDTCFAAGNVHRILKGKSGPRWQVIWAGCGKKGSDAVRDRCTAALLWNGVNLQTQCYADLPLFGLAGLSPRDAHPGYGIFALTWCCVSPCATSKAKCTKQAFPEASQGPHIG